MNPELIYPRPNDHQTVYLKNVVHDPSVVVGDFSIYNDFVNDPVDFEKNNVLYHYPINRERLVIGRYCSLACGARFLFTSGNHTQRSVANYPFPIFFQEWSLPVEEITSAWDNKGDIVLENDVWLGYETIVMQGVHIGNGAIVAARSIVTRDVDPYTIVAGSPARPVRKRFPEATIQDLLDLAWWNWPAEKVRDHLDAITRGAVDELR